MSQGIYEMYEHQGTRRRAACRPRPWAVDRTKRCRLARGLATCIWVAAALTGCADAQPGPAEVEAVREQSGATGGKSVLPRLEPAERTSIDGKRLEDMSVPELIAILGDNNSPLRSGSARRLGELGPKAAAAHPALVKMLDDPDASVRACAAEALASIKAIDAELIAKVIERLLASHVDAIERQPRWKARGLLLCSDEAAFIQLLATAGPPAIAPLSECLDDEAWFARAAGAMALGAIGPDAAPEVPAILALLDDDELTVRCSALAALGQIGTPAERIVPSLTAALRDEDPAIRAHAASSLGAVGAEAKSAVPDLVKLLDDPHAIVLRAVGQTLVDLGPDAESALPELIARLRDRNSYLRYHKHGYFELKGDHESRKIKGIPDVLLAIGPAAVPLLVETLEDDLWLIALNLQH